MLDHLNNKEKLVFTQNPHGSVEKLIADCARRPGPPGAGRAAVRPRQVRRVVRAGACGTDRHGVRGDGDRRTGALHGPDRGQAGLEGLVAGTGQRPVRHPQPAGEPGLPGSSRRPATRIWRSCRVIWTASRSAGQAGGRNVARDHQSMLAVQALEDEYDAALAALPAGVRTRPRWRIKWMIEELRVSLFAQGRDRLLGVGEADPHSAARGDGCLTAAGRPSAGAGSYCPGTVSACPSSRSAVRSFSAFSSSRRPSDRGRRGSGRNRPASSWARRARAVGYLESRHHQPGPLGAERPLLGASDDPGDLGGLVHQLRLGVGPVVDFLARNHREVWPSVIGPMDRNATTSGSFQMKRPGISPLMILVNSVLTVPSPRSSSGGFCRLPPDRRSRDGARAAGHGAVAE